ncbi:glutathione S-transferase family protein [Dongia deserti]|uniref:glutathione S-transferase family protein n=1 Tax=Dongia deserti TaxID=2268030 RepID=UPI000E64D5C9|nr:glutathione S-transferase family protein [Dongia deserti]
MKLYSLPLSPYSARVRAAIYAKQLDIEIVMPPEGWRQSEEFRQLNPARRVPVLILDDGTALPESGVIVEYLEDAFPAIPLRPRHAKDLAHVRLVTTVAELYVMQALMPLFFLLDAKTIDSTAVTAGFDKLDAGLAHLETLLRPGAYAHGERISMADVWLLPVRFTLDGLMEFAKRPDLLDRYPAIAGYTDVVKRDAALGRVWQEMIDGLKAFYAARAAKG